ncbi:MAG TPA: tetratricopeptide repeat protein [Casimicrobiaceae bacterium]|nr:tetratricopeptide repeat protein [Casimicrobiaceae bacterium]
MPDLPSGTVTFLFTDIEGSTRLWERSPAEMRVALSRHDALVRAAIEGNEGYIFSTGGDAFCAAFRTPTRALAAAYAAQIALGNEPWPETAPIRVRMAVHTGIAELRDNDYFGPPLNRVARLLAATHAGQVLISHATQELVRDGLPAGMSLRDMGEGRLKDLVRPERVFQVLAPGLHAEFPPLKTLDARANNLPIQSTSFVGREREMHEVGALLKSSRLVTLTGSGGAGKTRLALQVGADCIDDFADGVWFVELAPLTDARLVAQAVSTTLGIKEQPGISPMITLTREARDKVLLLLLDNCEHLVEASAQLCQAILTACAKVRIVVTSREILRIDGEATYRVPSLAIPDLKVPASLAVLSQYAAVKLFIERARAVQPSFQVNDVNAPAVASICFHLDGIPLAIELASARVRSLSVEEVNERLSHRFRLLTGGARTALPRQQTLRALIDWSYDLLTTAEQRLLCRLSVFAGGWTLSAAEHVCTGDGVDEAEVLDLFTSLVDKSLMLTEERGLATRYRMLETVREYASDRLREAGGSVFWQGRHLEYFLSVADVAASQLTGDEQQSWLGLLESEHDNLRSALAWSSGAGGNALGGLALAGAIWRFWHVRGYLNEGRSWLSELLAAAPSDQAEGVRARALNAAGGLAWQQGDYSAAQALYQECLAIRRRQGDQRGIAASLGNLGSVTLQQCDYPAARALYEECLAIFRKLGDRWAIAGALGNLGVAANGQGDFPAARSLHTETLTIRRELGDRRGIAASLGNLASVARDQGENAAARSCYEESMAIFQELGDRWGMVYSLEGLADVASDLAEPRRAARLWGVAESQREEIGAPMPPSDRRHHDGQVAIARATLGNDIAFDREWQEGRAMPLEQAVEYALRKQSA